MTGRQGSDTGQSHERLTRDTRVKTSSERSFGIVFAVVFTVVGLWPLVSGAAPRWWWLAGSAAVLAAALVQPKLLVWPNRAWTRFGLLLHAVVSPIILGLLFYLTVTPMGLILRILGKDPLRLRLEPAAKSYWIAREPPGPAPDTMKYQF